jgi:hypothetical protein
VEADADFILKNSMKPNEFFQEKYQIASRDTVPTESPSIDPLIKCKT